MIAKLVRLPLSTPPNVCAGAHACLGVRQRLDVRACACGYHARVCLRVTASVCVCTRVRARTCGSALKHMVARERRAQAFGDVEDPDDAPIVIEHRQVPDCVRRADVSTRYLKE
eukprot:6001796-Pleurochrysis_carterae.AAC.2